MPKTMVIVNPNAGKGYGAKISPQIATSLQRLGVAFDLVQTRGVGDAIELARVAAAQGYETIVAVGGDGTTHEVINGIMADANGHPTATLGCIPAGSGNDFAVMNGAPTDLHEACQVIANGHSQVVDLGLVTIDGSLRRYFDNAVGIGFDGMVTMETRKVKHLRGMALYLPVVLKTIFLTLTTPHVELTIDGQTQKLEALMLVVCNGPREGGAFHLAPEALFDDGLLDIVIAKRVPRLEMLALVPRFMRGTHLSHRAVSTVRGHSVEVRSQEPLYMHVDGEVLVEHAHHVQIEVVPAALRMMARY
jgi:YegS/Rv2252/BmrU family lipid kinase